MNKVEINPDTILIYVNGEIIASWIQDEWEADPSVVSAIAYAIKLFYTDLDSLTKILLK